MWFTSLLHSLRPSAERSREDRFPRQMTSRRRATHRFVPRLEALEDRMVPSYVFQTIDEPNAGTTGNGIQGTFPVGINASGQISGNYGDANNVAHGFLLSHGQFTSFDDPNAGTGAGQGTGAFGINTLGQIVGDYMDANNVLHGFLLSGGQYTTLDDPNAGTGAFQGTLAYGINDAGKIVGFYYDANNVVHGFLATPVHANAALGASNNLASSSNLTSASGPLNLLVAAAGLSNATPP